MSRIAQVVFDLPLEGPFDYFIPSALENCALVGTRVKALLSSKKSVGIIVKIIEKSEFENIKSIQALVDEKPILDEEQMILGHQMSAYYGCSLGDALFTVIRGCENSPVKSATTLARHENSSVSLHISNAGDYKAILTALIKPVVEKKEKVLVIVPDQSLFEEVQTFLKKHCTAASYYIGMRSAIFSSFKEIGLVIMMDEDHSSFKEAQTPKYEARDILLWRSKLEKVSLAFISTTATVELMQRIKEEKDLLKEYPSATVIKPQAIDINQYKTPSRWYLSPVVTSSLNKNLSKGLSSILVVNHHAGVEELQKELRRSYPQAKMVVFKKDQSELKDFDILIGTSVLLRFKKSLKVQTVILLDIDGDLNRLDVRSCFRTWSMAVQFQAMAIEQFFVQTRQIDHYVIQALVKNNSSYFYTEDMKNRLELGISPFGHQVRIDLRSKEQKKMEQLSKDLYELLKKNAPKDIDLQEPMADKEADKKGQWHLNILLQGPDVIGMITVIKRTLAQIKRNSKVIVTINVDP